MSPPARPPAPPRQPPRALDPATGDLIRAKARQVAHRAGLTRSDLPDLEQDIALHVWQRLGRFDPAKADRGPFLRMLVAHAVATALRGRVRRARRAPAALDAALRAGGGGPAEPADRGASRRAEEAALALDVAAVLASLPPRLRRVAESLQARSVAAAARELGLTRAAVYRRLGELRAAFAAAGLGESCGRARTPRPRPG
jgi:DNA-directed RNA polymerase specialized sigma24 family protein